MFGNQKRHISEGKNGLLTGLLLSEIKASRERSKSTGEAQIIQADITQLLNERSFLDPWDFASQRDMPDDSKAFLWHDGRSGRSFYAAGVLDERTFDGEERFDLAQEFLEQAKRRLIQLPAVINNPKGSPPFMVGGFGFSSNLSKDGVWRNWPNGWMVVPKVIAYRCDNETRVVCNMYVEPNSPDSSTSDQLNEIMEILAVSNSAHATTSLKCGPPSAIEQPNDWKTRVEEAQKQISAGYFDKVVPARSVVMPIESNKWDHNNSIETLISLKGRHPTAVTFGVINGELGSFLGSSPEFLVCANDGLVTAEAVAGTRRRDMDNDLDKVLSDELLSNPKERAEHDMVVQFIKSQMEAVGVKPQVASVPSIRQLSHIQHLHTPMFGTIPNGTSVLKLAESLHPTPAVAGLPRRAALKHISDTEDMDRGWYSGPIGWLHEDGDGEFIVGLRSALVRDNEIHAFAGAGVVEGSDFAAEWRETSLKLSAICDVIFGSDTQEDLVNVGEK